MNWKMLGALVVVSMSCGSTLKVTRVQKDDSAEGVYFALPKAQLVLRGDVRATTVEKPRCDPAKYAVDLGLTARKEGKKFELKNLALSTQAVPDTERLYRLEVDPSAFQKSSLAVTLSPIQTITGTVASTENKGWEFASSVFSTAGSVAAGVVKAFVGGSATPVTESPFNDKACEELKKTLKSAAEKRLQLITFNNNVAPDSNKELYLEAISRADVELEAALAPFIGARTVVTRPFVCVADVAASDEISFAQFDKNTGHLNGANCIGPTGKETGVELKVQLAQKVAAFEKDSDDPQSGAGLPYRIPARYRGVLTYEEQTIVGDLVVPQRGAVRRLQAKLQDELDVKYDGDTGALQSFTGKRAAVSIDASKFGEGANSVVGAIDGALEKKKSAAKDAEEAEIAALERKIKLLEAQKKITELQGIVE